MSITDEPKWVWERTDVKRSGSSGDIAKLFKNEGTKQPGVFAAGAPSAEATLMAREVIQNSWDAARELRTDLGDDAPPFDIEFAFSDVDGDARSHLLGVLDLNGLRTQLAAVDAKGPGERAKIGLGISNVLDVLNGTSPMRTLTITERGTTGMYGPFTDAKSKLYLALISIGYTVKSSGSGGSYGYGKAGLIAASATRTVIAYTCFREREDDPGVTRRLLGMTYWGQHEIDGESFTGFARFGKTVDDWVKPFENEEADAIAAALGLDLRSAASANELGTTFLLVDPDVEPEELSVAIGRNWWPAVIDEDFHPSVKYSAAEETKLYPVRPRQDPVLKSFIRAWELATTPQDNAVVTEYRKDLGRSPGSAGSLPLGWLGLTADLGGWSYAITDDSGDDDEPVVSSHSSLIALVRGPRMVVEYYSYRPGNTPYVRGVFVAAADERVDDLLRQTEPKAHDAWQTKVPEEGVDSRAPLLADAVLKGVRAAVRDFQKRLKPPIPDVGDVRLPIFQELFRNLMSGKGKSRPKPPAAGPRDVSVRVRQGVEVEPNGLDIRLEAQAEFELSPNFTSANSCPVVVRFSYKFLEDGAAGETCPLNVTPAEGFEATDDGTYVGTLTRTPVKFGLRSDGYNAEWSGRLTVTCDVDRPKLKQQLEAARSSTTGTDDAE